MKRILVTGATETVGRQVVSQLLATDAEVRAMTRNPESAALPEVAQRELPFPAAPLNMLLNAWAAAIGQPALVTSTVAEITGKPARSFRDRVTDNADEFCA